MDRAGVIVCGSYDIVVGADLLDDVPADVLKKVPASRYVVVTDENVDRVYGARVREAFKDVLPRDQEVRAEGGKGGGEREGGKTKSVAGAFSRPLYSTSLPRPRGAH